MQSFIPQKILVEEEVSDLPLSRRILGKFPQIPNEVISRCQAWKEPAPMTSAKKILMLAAQRGKAVKPFPKIKGTIYCGDYVFNPVSNCHLECTYCILQSYLKNNPVITLFANLEHFLDEILQQTKAFPHRNIRFGTGELSDSLALDEITALSTELIPFFAELPHAFLELKTKSNCIDNLLSLHHRGNTVISWSLAPEKIVRSEELKCASLAQRLQSAKRVQEAGYPIGLHLDPLIHFEGWREGYRDLISQIAGSLDPSRIAWVSVGSLRFDKTLKEIAMERFPHTTLFSEDFIDSPDGKRRYFKTIRVEMYREVWRCLREWDLSFPRYLCMEPAWLWESVTAEQAPESEAVEEGLIRRLEELRE